MFAPPFSQIWPLLLASALFIGGLVGGGSGSLVSRLLGLPIRLREIAIDGLLGALAFPLGFVGILLIPWRNTITYHLGSTLVTSTASTYQHPDYVGYLLAVVIPVVRELLRFKRTKVTST